MKKLATLMTLIGTLSTPALADGFVCRALDEDLNVRVYNHTSPEKGTRNAAIMVLSDPTVQSDRKTIAVFKDSTGLLSSETLSYDAKVDLRYKNSSRKGEYVAGTRLGYVDRFILDVFFSYVNPLRDGELTDAIFTIVKRNGEEITLDMECERYLKNRR